MSGRIRLLLQNGEEQNHILCFYLEIESGNKLPFVHRESLVGIGSGLQNTKLYGPVSFSKIVASNAQIWHAIQGYFTSCLSRCEKIMVQKKILLLADLKMCVMKTTCLSLFGLIFFVIWC